MSENIVEPVFLSLDEVLEIHEQQIEGYGGSHGLRDAAGLESAVATAPGDVRRRIPAYLHSGYGRRTLVSSLQNHAFIDGNKRVGANAAITFLLMNGWEPKFEEEELVDLVLSVASGMLGKPALIEIFESRSQALDEA